MEITDELMSGSQPDAIIFARSTGDTALPSQYDDAGVVHRPVLCQQLDHLERFLVHLEASGNAGLNCRPQ